MAILNIYHLPKGQPLPENAVYIGRARPEMGLKQSLFANPYPLPPRASVELRNKVIERYRQYLWREIKEGRITLEDILALKGKDLVCYCAPRRCHGEIVQYAIQWADLYRRTQKAFGDSNGLAQLANPLKPLDTDS